MTTKELVNQVAEIKRELLNLSQKAAGITQIQAVLSALWLVINEGTIEDLNKMARWNAEFAVIVALRHSQNKGSSPQSDTTINDK